MPLTIARYVVANDLLCHCCQARHCRHCSSCARLQPQLRVYALHLPQHMSGHATVRHRDALHHAANVGIITTRSAFIKACWA